MLAAGTKRIMVLGGMVDYLQVEKDMHPEPESIFVSVAAGYGTTSSNLAPRWEEARVYLCDGSIGWTADN